MTLTGKRLDFPSPPRKKAPASAWPAFERRLAETLGALEEDQYLVVSAKRGWAYVQFAAQGSFGLRAECVEQQLPRRGSRVEHRPAGAAAEDRLVVSHGNAGADPASRRTDGSPNFFRDFDRPVPCADAARMAVRALTEVFDIRHPGSLEYKAFDKKQRTILVPTLGLKREESASPPARPREDAVQGLRALVLKAIREGSGNTDLELDKDGDIALRFGSAAVFVRVLGDSLGIGIFSAVLEDVEADDRLLDRLNELNAKTLFARFFVVEGRVIVAVETLVAPFVDEHVSRACLQLGSLADRIGGELQKEFGGRRGFEEGAEGQEVQ